MVKAVPYYTPLGKNSMEISLANDEIATSVYRHCFVWQMYLIDMPMF